MKVYYAHCISLYGTLQETRDVMTLRSLGFDVLNPNQKEYQERADRVKSQGEDVIVNVFWPLVHKCGALAFRALPDGAIPSGVAKEIAYAQGQGRPVFELPSMMSRRIIGITETREYLHEVGQR